MNQENDNCLEAVMSFVPSAMAKIALTRYLKLVFANELFYQLMNVTSEDLEKQNYELLTMVSKQNQSFIIMQIYDKNSIPVSSAQFELTLANEKNGTRWVSVSIKKADELYMGQYPIYYCSFNDITRLKEKISALSSQFIKVQRLFDNVVSGIGKIVLDNNFTLIYGNDSFFSLLGYTRRDYSNLINNSTLESVYEQDVMKLRNFLITNYRDNNKTFTLEIRLLKIDGSIIWVKIDGSLSGETYNGYPVYYCIFTNIDELKKTQLKLATNYEQLNIISSITNDIIFRYNAVRDKLTFSDSFREVFGCYPVFYKFTKFLKYIKKLDVISSNSYSDLISNLDATKDKDTIVSYIELQIKTVSNEYVWFSLYGKNTFDEAGKYVATVGKIVNIDKVHKEKEFLTERALYDGLTKIYNRSATEALIKKRLTMITDGSLYGLFVIDIDNFKQINDTYGHPCGDTVLKEISVKLKSYVTANDILGRLGGDEFVIFCYDTTSIEDFVNRGNHLCEELRSQLLQNNKSIRYSVSIGGAICSDSTVNYKYLYRIADDALYRSKNNGKSTFNFEVIKGIH